MRGVYEVHDSCTFLIFGNFICNESSPHTCHHHPLKNSEKSPQIHEFAENQTWVRHPEWPAKHDEKKNTDILIFRSPTSHWHGPKPVLFYGPCKRLFPGKACANHQQESNVKSGTPTPNWKFSEIYLERFTWKFPLSRKRSWISKWIVPSKTQKQPSLSQRHKLP